jgi:hypothetical protein
MTGLFPVIYVVKLPEKLRIGRNRSRVDGRDKPGHDGEGGLNGTASLILALMGVAARLRIYSCGAAASRLSS